MSEDKYYKWEELVSKTARFVARDFPEVLEEDLFQDLMTYVLENKRLANPDIKGVTTALYRQAVRLAWEWRKQALYMSAQYSYRTTDVRKILETLFDRSDWEVSYLPDDAKSLSDDDRLIVNVDLKVAYDRISPVYREVLFDRYALGIIPAEGAPKKRLQRAIEALTDALNFYYDPRDHTGPGSRRAISNAAAAYKIQEQDG